MLTDNKSKNDKDKQQFFQLLVNDENISIIAIIAEMRSKDAVYHKRNKNIILSHCPAEWL